VRGKNMDQFKKTIIDFKNQLSFKPLKFSNLNKLKNLKPDGIVIVGMGGSGQIGDIISSLKKELNLPVPVLCWKDYFLPETNFKNPLFIFISFSGNTEETLSGINMAKNKAIVCSGGKLAKISKKLNIPTAIFENIGIKPRQGNGLMFYGTLGILKACFPKMKIKEVFIKPGLEKTGKEIAKKISNKIVLLYSSLKNNRIAYNWKTRLNETSKTPAFSEIIPEICHNEIEIFENKIFSKKMAIVLIEDDSDSIFIKNKIKKLKKVFTKNKIYFISIYLNGKNLSEKTWNSLVLADWTSYYLAELNKVNPEETSLIDLLKSIK
jgi:glucose/mannose-6-phosphate isomerase